jgi:hypothetical protein
MFGNESFQGQHVLTMIQDAIFTFESSKLSQPNLLVCFTKVDRWGNRGMNSGNSWKTAQISRADI